MQRVAQDPPRVPSWKLRLPPGACSRWRALHVALLSFPIVAPAGALNQARASEKTSDANGSETVQADGSSGAFEKSSGRHGARRWLRAGNRLELAKPAAGRDR